MKKIYDAKSLQELPLKDLKQEYAHAIYCHYEFGGIYKDYLKQIVQALEAKNEPNISFVIEFEELRKRPMMTARERWKVLWRKARLKNQTEILDPFFIDHRHINGVHVVVMGGPLVVEQGKRTAPAWGQSRTSFYYMLEHLIEQRYKRKARWILELRKCLRQMGAEGFKLP